MKLEMTMKEMQELISKKGQVEIMGKTYVLNPQDELLIKFIMDYKEKRPMDYYDIISTLFNNALVTQPLYGYNQPIYPQQQMWSNGCYSTMQMQPFPNQAPQMSYEDMKNMYKKQFASQLGLDIDGDEEEHPCACCSNCEENITSEITEEEIEKDEPIINRVNEIYQKCRENGEMDEESKKELEEIGYKLGYQDGYKTGKQDYINGIPYVQTIPNASQFDPELLQSKFIEKLTEVGVYGAEGRRFTGKKDKNDNNIYEGDILKCKLNSGEYENYLVVWNANEARFDAINHDDSNFMCPSIWNEFEIIGNYEYNPELMKEETSKGKPFIEKESLVKYIESNGKKKKLIYPRVQGNE